MGKSARFFRLPTSEKRAAFEAILRLIGMRAAITVVPFRRLAEKLGEVNASSGRSMAPDSADAETAASVARAISRGANALPWNSTCLVRALAGHRMLKTRGIDASLFLGVRPGEDGPLDAHAWLKASDQFVTGEGEHHDFKVLAVFE